MTQAFNQEPMTSSPSVSDRPDEAVGALAEALTQVSVGDGDLADNVNFFHHNVGDKQECAFGSSAFEANGPPSSYARKSGTSSSNSGLLWRSSPASMNNGEGIPHDFSYHIPTGFPANSCGTAANNGTSLLSSCGDGPVEGGNEAESGQRQLFVPVQNSTYEHKTPGRARKKSIDIFLSRSPSETLGDELLKLRNQNYLGENSKGTIGLEEQKSLSGPGFTSGGTDSTVAPHFMSQNPDFLAASDASKSQKQLRQRSSGSPSCSVTGTSASSRSVSPTTIPNVGLESWCPDGSHFPGEYEQFVNSSGNYNLGARNDVYPNQKLNEAFNSPASAPESLRSSPSGTSLASFSGLNPQSDLYTPQRINAFQEGTKSISRLQLEGSMLNETSLSYKKQDNQLNFAVESSKEASQGIHGLYHHPFLHQQFGLSAATNRSSGPEPPTAKSPLGQPFSSSAQDASVNFASPRRLDGSVLGGVNSKHAGLPLEQVSSQIRAQQIQHHQAFYMAVPTPDGRGQVLQPVQMIQLPGNPSAFILPTGAQASGVLPGNGGSRSVPPIAQGQQSHEVASPPFVMMHSNTGKSDQTAKSAPHGFGSGERKQTYRRGKADAADGHYQDALYMDESSQANGTNVVYGGFEENLNYSSQYRGVMPGSLMHGKHSLPPVRTNLINSQRSSPRSSPTPRDPSLSLYASPQRPTLDELLCHVRRLSRDQVGCRLLQQALDEEGSKAASLILKEGLSFWGEAMVDPFGNYLFQKLLEKITGEERVLLVRSVSTRLVNASLNLHGTRSVQKVVELCAADEAAAAAANGERYIHRTGTAAEILTGSLAPAAARLCIDSHGNHVIQRILLKLPHHFSQFVFEAVAASVGDVARHRHGCCVIQRCLDSPPSKARTHLVRRIVEKSLELMQDAYGNYVVQYVLDVCSDEDVYAVCESVTGKVCSLSIQKFSSNVVEKCLERCTDKIRQQYLMELSDPERIKELMMDPFGNYVVQRALAVATHSQAIRLVGAMKPHLMSNSGCPENGGIRNTAGGRRIMAKISKRFPDFNLGDENVAEDQMVPFKGNQRNHHAFASQHHHHNRHHDRNQHLQNGLGAAHVEAGRMSEFHYGGERG